MATSYAVVDDDTKFNLQETPEFISRMVILVVALWQNVEASVQN